MGEHKQGTMDIRVQEKTYEGFIKLTIRSTITILVLLVLLAMFNA